MRQRLIASIALVLLPATAGAERLLYGGRSEVFWTDNVFGTAEDGFAGQAEVVPDWAGRLAPWADLGDYDGELTWGLRYAPTYEYYLDQSGLQGFDHDLGGRLGWQVGDRTTLRLSERYQRYHGLTSFNEVNKDTHVSTGNTVGERQGITANTITGSLAHQLGPRDEITLSAYQNLYDLLGVVEVGTLSDGMVVKQERPDHSFLGASLLYDHRLSQRATIGSRASWGRQTVQRVDPPLLDPLAEPSDLPDLVTNFYNLSGVFTYRFSPTFDVELSAGPALIEGTADQLDPSREYGVARFPLQSSEDGLHFVDATTCKEISPGVHVFGAKCQAIAPALTPQQLFALNFNTNNNTAIVPFEGVVPSIEASSTTYFADVRFNKQWERWTGSLAYSRSASQSSTVASVSDYLTGELRWRIAERWTADLAAGFERREQASENVVLVTQVANEMTPVAAFDSAARALSVRAATVDSGSHVDVLGLNLRVTYQLARQSALYANVGWQEETQVFEAFEQQSTRLALTVGINFNFDPVNF